MKYKKCLKKILLVVLTFIFFIMGFNYIIDPFQHYRKSTIYSFNFKGNQRYINPGLAKNYDYKSIIIGTSMTENFSLLKASKIINDPIKLSIAGGSAFEFNKLLQIAFNKSNNKIEKVLFGIDVYSFLGDFNNLSNGYLPEYLYDDNVLNDYKYLFNIDVLSDSFKLFLTIFNKSKVDTNYNKMFEWQDSYSSQFKIENVIKSWENRDAIFNHKSKNWNLELLEDSFDKNIFNLIKENKNIKFYIFYPPYSILTYKDWEEKKILDTIVAFKEYIFFRLKSLNNVELYDFQIDNDITFNLNNYKDLTHYSQNINDKIILQIYNKKNLLEEENFNENKIKFREQLNSYNVLFK